MSNKTQTQHRRIVVMGVSGSGKSTVGKLLAERIGAAFFDADDYHSAENKAKMSAGIPLTDTDRAGWLSTLAELLRDSGSREGTVLACSALKQAYRDILAAGGPVTFVYLKGSYEEVLAQMTKRSGHFMKSDMLASQFAILQEPPDAITVGIGNNPELIVDKVVAALAPGGAHP